VLSMFLLGNLAPPLYISLVVIGLCGIINIYSAA